MGCQQGDETYWACAAVYTVTVSQSGSVYQANIWKGENEDEEPNEDEHEDSHKVVKSKAIRLKGYRRRQTDSDLPDKKRVSESQSTTFDTRQSDRERFTERPFLE